MVLCLLHNSVGFVQNGRHSIILSFLETHFDSYDEPTQELSQTIDFHYKVLQWVLHHDHTLYNPEGTKVSNDG